MAKTEKMVSLVKIIFIICIFFLMFPCYSFSYDNVKTHPAINSHAAEQSVLASEYILFELGFKEGLDSEVQIKDEKYKIRKWFEKGGIDEDDSPRYCYHFHDPLQDWGEAGLDMPIFPQFDSSITYANDPEWFYSWKTARVAYSNAISAGNEEEYAIVFLTLGHLMHLVSDLGVPAHVRNDPHPIDPDAPWLSWIARVIGSDSVLSDPYEEWVKENVDTDKVDFTAIKMPASIFDNFVQSGTDFDLAPTPITALWDQNRYTLENPDPSVTKSAEPIFDNIGLAEYANANFFSTDTVFSPWKYPHPAQEDITRPIDWLKPEVHVSEDGETDYRYYVWGYAGGTSQIRMAAGGLFSYDCMALNSEGAEGLDHLAHVLDDEVHKDYASLLVPRAVGYSTALVDYFFRGKLQVVSLPIYTKNRYYSLVGLKIKNITETEEGLVDGTFALVMRHPNPDYNPNDSDSSAEIYTQAFADYYSTVTEVSISQLDFNEETEIYFYLPFVDLKPEDAESISFMLAYRGGLGNEKDAVIGKYFKPEAVEIFVEEWDSLIGSCPWQHTTAEMNPDNGTTSTSYVETTDLFGNPLTLLKKDNVRYAGYDTGRLNQTTLDLSTQDFPITSNTYVQFKIDAMDINSQPPSESGTTSAWQFLSLEFSDGSALQFSADGQGVWLGTSTFYYNFGEGYLFRGNIYNLLQKGPEAANPIFLEKISFTQELDNLEDPSLIQHEQHMEIDSIRLFEAVPK